MENDSSSAKKSAVELTYTTLPDEIIADHILVRLAVKPLMRFQSVSKGWLRMLSSRKFAKKHLEFWSSSNDRTFVVQEHYNLEDKYYLSLDENYNLDEFVQFKYKYHTCQLRYVNTRVVGSSNGLLCLYNEHFKHTFVWNPVTNECRDTFGPAPFNKIHEYRVRCVGFGYVSSVDDYKIGCLIFIKGVLSTYVFSLKTGAWLGTDIIDTSYIDKPKINSVFVDDSKVFVEDTLYWGPQRLDKEENYIISLNLVDLKLVMIPFLNKRGDFASVKLFQMKGCLAYCLIEEDEENGWTICHVSTMTRSSERDNFMTFQTILSITYVGANFVHLFETGKCLVNKISFESYRLMLHELWPISREKKGKEKLGEGTIVWESEARRSSLRYFTGNTWGYTESLISPFEEPNLLVVNQAS